MDLCCVSRMNLLAALFPSLPFVIRSTMGMDEDVHACANELYIPSQRHRRGRCGRALISVLWASCIFSSGLVLLILLPPLSGFSGTYDSLISGSLFFFFLFDGLVVVVVGVVLTL